MFLLWCYRFLLGARQRRTPSNQIGSASSRQVLGRRAPSRSQKLVQRFRATTVPAASSGSCKLVADRRSIGSRTIRLELFQSVLVRTRCSGPLRAVLRAGLTSRPSGRAKSRAPLNSSVSRQCSGLHFQGKFVATWGRSHAPASKQLRPTSSPSFRLRLARMFLVLRGVSLRAPGSTHSLRSQRGLRRFVQHRALPWWHRRLTRRSSGRRTAAAYLCVRPQGERAVTKDQFVRLRSEFYKRDRRFNTVYLALFFAALIAAIPLSSHVPEQYQGTVGISFLVLLVANAAIVTLHGRGQAKRAGLVCRSCNGGLLGIPGDIAVATGSCPHCGQLAFAQ